MRLRLLAATIGLSLAAVAPPLVAAQRGSIGRIQNMTATADATIPIRLFTVNGTNPCTSIEMDYGEGTVVTHPVRDLPVTFGHEYRRTGDFTIRARGMGNCEGTATATVRITTLRPPPPPPPTPPTAPPPGRGQPPTPPPPAVPRTPIRFADMDRNGDGVITRAEWLGSDQSFDVHDWNNDGRLSGDEVRVGALPPAGGNRRQPDAFSDWTEMRFRQLDQNRDNRIARGEWRYDVEDFIRIDRNRDNALSLNEFLLGDIDDDRGDRFDDLDLNRNNRIDRNEWHGSLEAFRWLDQNNDGVLSRFEAVGADLPSRQGQPGRGQGQPGRGDDRGVTIQVSSRVAWTDAGINVRAGDLIAIRATGAIYFSAKGSDLAEPDGARGRRSTNAAPMPNVEIGALIGRIGNSAPFFVGADAQGLRAPRDGRLYLGVNDDILRDNRGDFRVIVNVGQGRGR